MNSLNFPMTELAAKLRSNAQLLKSFLALFPAEYSTDPDYQRLRKVLHDLIAEDLELANTVTALAAEANANKEGSP